MKRDDSFRVTYLVRAAPEDIAARAEALTLEQTVELPRATAGRDPWVAAHLLGTVEAIEPAGDDLHRVTIAQPLATVGDNPAQLLNVLFGNSSLQPDVTLADVELPEAAFAWLPGPRAGIAGIRGLPASTAGPCSRRPSSRWDCPPSVSPRSAGSSRARGSTSSRTITGWPIIASVPSRRGWRPASVRRRTPHATLDRLPIYVPNLIGTPDAVARQLEFARAAGARMVLISPMVTGMPLLAQLAAEADGAPLLAHPAFAGVLRADEPALLGKLFRWFGADAVIFPHTGGRFGYSLETCRRACARHSARTGPAPAPRSRSRRGASRSSACRSCFAFYGPDTILLLGSSLYEAGDGTVRAHACAGGSGRSGCRRRRWG